MEKCAFAFESPSVELIRWINNENIKMWIKPKAKTRGAFTHILTFYNNSDTNRKSTETSKQIEERYIFVKR